MGVKLLRVPNMASKDAMGDKKFVGVLGLNKICFCFLKP